MTSLLGSLSSQAVLLTMHVCGNARQPNDQHLAACMAITAGRSSAFSGRYKQLERDERVTASWFAMTGMVHFLIEGAPSFISSRTPAQETSHQQGCCCPNWVPASLTTALLPSQALHARASLAQATWYCTPISLKTPRAVCCRRYVSVPLPAAPSHPRRLRCFSVGIDCITRPSRALRGSRLQHAVPMPQLHHRYLWIAKK